jgi:hypothetical protein
MIALARIEGGKELQGHYRDFESRVTFYFNDAVGSYAESKVAKVRAARAGCLAACRCATTTSPAEALINDQLLPGRAFTFS